MSEVDSDQRHAPVKDGVVMELARDDCERKKFLRMAGKSMGGAAAASALGAFISACGSSSKKSSTSGGGGGSSSSKPPSGGGNTSTSPMASVPASFGKGDLGIVNYALTLEYLEAAFYKKVGASGLFSGPVLAQLKIFGKEEAEHVKALHAVAKMLGKPAAKPKAKFPLKSAASVTMLAATVENLGAAAYLGQAAHIQSKQILAAALAIHTVEARHAATLNLLLKKSTTPDGAFAKPADAATVLAAVKPFIVA